MPEMRRLGSNSVVALPVVSHNNATQQERHGMHAKKVQVGPVKINRRSMRDARQPVIDQPIHIALMMNQEPVQTTFHVHPPYLAKVSQGQGMDLLTKPEPPTSRLGTVNRQNLQIFFVSSWIHNPCHPRLAS